MSSSSPSPSGSTASSVTVLRHLVATLAYRAAKVLRDVPPGFAAASAGVTARQPVQIIGHMADLMAWAITMAQGGNVWNAGGSGDWDTEVARFFDGLGALDRELAARNPDARPVEQLIQGPLADALTHVGQLAMLRGLSGSPTRPENYARAEIVVGRVGREQAAARREFDGDASARRD